jgi:hypothetical protein
MYMKKIMRSIATAIQKPPIATILCIGVALVAMGHGGAMFRYSEDYLSDPVYESAMRFASPFAWGVAFVGAAVILLISLSVGNRDKRVKGHKEAQLPLLVMGFIFVGMGASTISVPPQSGVVSPVWLWVGYSVFSLIAQLACREEEIENDKATDCIN